MLPESVVQYGKSVLTLNRDREFKELNRMLELKRSDSLLDVGCGDGFWTMRFARECAHVTGIDPGARTIDSARRLHHADNVKYVRSAGEALPFPDKTFDKIVSVSSLEHFGDPVQGLREMARVLKPGGRLAVSVDSMLPENTDPAFMEWHRIKHFVTRYFSQDDLFNTIETLGLCCDRDHAVHLFRSRLAARLRQIFIRRPRQWLPLFPLFYAGVRVADRFSNDMPGQIIIVNASRSAA